MRPDDSILLSFQLKDILDARLQELRKKLDDIRDELEVDKKMVCFFLP